MTWWELWKARNDIISRDTIISLSTLSSRIASYFDPRPHRALSKPRRIIHHAEIDYSYPLGYFDGAAQNGLCGAGGVLKIS